MVQGGAGNTDATKTDTSKKLAALILENSQKHPALANKLLRKLESKNSAFKIMNAGDTPTHRVGDEELVEELVKDKELLKTIADHFIENPEELAELLEQAKKVDGMEKKLRVLDKKLSIGTDVTMLLTLATGTLAGFAIAGPVGGIIGVLVAAAVLMFAALFLNRGEIKESAKNVQQDFQDMWKGIGQSLENFINKYSRGLSHGEKFYEDVANEDAQERYNKAGNPLPDDAAFVGQYLLNKDGFQALKSLIIKNKGAITVENENKEQVKLTLEDLTTLKNGSKGKSQEAKDRFDEQLDKFKLLMTEANKDVRAQVEATQDLVHIHKGKESKGYSETPIPSSPGYPGSIANTALLKDVGDENRRVVKNLLKKVAELRDTGTDNGFRKDFHEFARDSHQLDTSVLEGKDSPKLQELAGKLKNLGSDQITALNAKVDELKKDQSKGQQPQTSQIKETPAQLAPPGQAAGRHT